MYFHQVKQENSEIWEETEKFSSFTNGQNFSTSLNIIIHVCISVHMVLIQDLRLALWAVGDLGNISQESLKQSLEQLFQGVLQKLPVQVVQEATQQTASLLFKLYDR